MSDETGQSRFKADRDEARTPGNEATDGIESNLELDEEHTDSCETQKPADSQQRFKADRDE